MAVGRHRLQAAADVDWERTLGTYFIFAVWGGGLFGLLWYLGIPEAVAEQEVWRPSYVGVDSVKLVFVSLVLGLTAAVVPTVCYQRDITVRLRGVNITPVLYITGSTALLFVVIAVGLPSTTDGAVEPLVVLVSASSLGAVAEQLLDILAWWALATAILGMALAPPTAAAWAVRRRLEGGFRLDQRGPQAAALLVAFLLTVAIVAPVIAGTGADDRGPVGDPATPAPDDGIAHIQSSGDVTPGVYRPLPREFRCADPTIRTDHSWVYPDYPAATVMHNSDHVQIAPLYWDREGKSGRVEGWYAIRVVDETGSVPEDRVLTSVAYAAEDSEWLAPTISADSIAHLDRAAKFYTVYDIVDENGSIHRHTAAVCPPEPGGDW